MSKSWLKSWLDKLYIHKHNINNIYISICFHVSKTIMILNYCKLTIPNIQLGNLNQFIMEDMLSCHGKSYSCFYHIKHGQTTVITCHSQEGKLMFPVLLTPHSSIWLFALISALLLWHWKTYRKWIKFSKLSYLYQVCNTFTRRGYSWEFSNIEIAVQLWWGKENLQ